jgi:valyl-tRNA synthetase
LTVLGHVLETSLRLLHPFMPFITEELWQNLKKHLKGIDTASIMVAAYPEADEAMIDPAVETEIDTVIEIIHNTRNVRAQYKVEPNRWIEAGIYAETSVNTHLIPHKNAISALARANPVSFHESGPGIEPGDNTLVLPLEKATIVIPMSSMFDVAAEKQRIDKEIGQVRAETARLEARLQDQAFLTKAPPAVVAKERQKLYTLSDKLEKLRQQSSRL